MDPSFRTPSGEYRPKFRWWWPGGAVEGGQLARDLHAMADAGFRGAEIAVLPLGLPDTGDPAVRSWGTPAFTRHLEAALTAARDSGQRLDITVGPAWPLVSPAVAGDHRDLSQQELIGGHQEVDGGTFDGPVPAPEDLGGDASLVAVTAARVTGGSPDAAPVLLDAGSLRDLTGQVQGGRLRWGAPSPGRWVVFGFWRRPTGQTALAGATSGDAPVVDHFSATAVEAATGFLDEHVLPHHLDPLLEAAAGDLFEDSLEVNGAQWWTPALPEEFERRRGYDLTPYLPVLHIQRLHEFLAALMGGVTPDSPPEFELPDGLGRRVRHDYYRTLNELYREHHVVPLRRWANGRGLRYRAQPYGGSIDAVSTAGVVEIPESEDLAAGMSSGGVLGWLRGEPVPPDHDTVDFHRGIAAGAHWQGHSLVSLECCAELGADYAVDLARLKRLVDTAFAGGVTQLVAHGYAYDRAPEATWPGWSPFSTDSGGVSEEPGAVTFSEAWGPRQPMWRHLPHLAGYLSRAAVLLRHGTPRIDLAVYRQEHWTVWPKLTAANLAEAGYTHEFLSATMLASDGAVVRDGRLAPDRAGYRALVIDNETAMDPEILERVGQLARDGLPVVFSGTLPRQVPGLRDAERADARVRALVEEILRLPLVRQVATQDEVLGALSALGVAPDCRLRGATAVHTVHRAAPEGDCYVVFNRGLEPARLTGAFRGTGEACLLDCWEGASRPVASTVQEDGRRLVELELAPGQSTALFLGEGPGLDAEPAAPTAAADAPTRWSRTLTGWELEVEAWQPSGTSAHRVHLDELQDWRSVPEITEASGVGHYRTTLTLPPGWQEGTTTVRLDLGTLAGASALVWVNGRRAGAGSVTGEPVDIGPLLREGPNDLDIEVATTLGNQLVALARKGTPGYARFAGRDAGPVGLLGPVSVTALG